MKKSTLLTGPVKSFLERISDRSYLELAAIYVSIVLLFAFLYLFLHFHHPAHAPNLPEGPLHELLFNSLYFSIMTATTVGYGDIAPHGFSKALASAETIVGFLVFAIFISKLITGRQERAILQMHKLTIKDNATNIREGFYIIRRDFDALMEDLEGGSFSERSQENLSIALRHGEMLLKDIPGLYITDERLYAPGPRRELLLAEAVQRTFERLEQLMAMLNDKAPRWKQGDAGLMHRELLQTASETIADWNKRAVDGSLRVIEKIGESLERLKM